MLLHSTRKPKRWLSEASSKPLRVSTADRASLSSDSLCAFSPKGREVSRRQLNEEIDVLIVEIDRPCKDGEEGPCKGERPLSQCNSNSSAACHCHYLIRHAGRLLLHCKEPSGSDLNLGIGWAIWLQQTCKFQFQMVANALTSAGRQYHAHLQSTAETEGKTCMPATPNCNALLGQGQILITQSAVQFRIY